MSIEDLQKKIIPWHVLLPSRADVENMSEGAKARKLSNHDGLVLVASLIDRVTNLGGISRTCEIFNIKELVGMLYLDCLSGFNATKSKTIHTKVPSIRSMDDKEFQTLSVTAEKWLNVKEVPVRYLNIYLKEMKACGYVLIGLEQTANSMRLDKFEFPANSLLLLGYYSEIENFPNWHF